MKLTIIGPDNSKLLQALLNGKHVSKGYQIFVDSAYEAYLEQKYKGDNERMKQENNPVTRAWQEYTELKKNNFSDGQIRKIAQIVMACAIDEAKVIDPITGKETKN